MHIPYHLLPLLKVLYKFFVLDLLFFKKFFFCIIFDCSTYSILHSIPVFIHQIFWCIGYSFIHCQVFRSISFIYHILPYLNQFHRFSPKNQHGKYEKHPQIPSGPNHNRFSCAPSSYEPTCGSFIHVQITKRPD